MSETFLKHGGHALKGGERHQIVVHVDAETLHKGVAGRCEMEEGPSLPVETVRRLSCDSSVVLLLENAEGEPLNVGRRTRSIPPAIHRALNARDRGCRFPGCTHTRYVHAHHVHHWALGGEKQRSRGNAELTPLSANELQGNAISATTTAGENQAIVALVQRQPH